MRINKILIVATALVSGLTFAKPVKKAAPKGKKKPGTPAAAAPAAAPAGVAPAETTAAAPMEHSYSAPYGMAGCGLGPMLIKPDGFVQVFASTINHVLSENQTFGITFGSLECNPSNPKTAAMEQRVFVESNLVSLNREAASGEGETLSAFADLLGCDAALFSKVSKENFGQLYQSSEPNTILSGYKTLLADQCSRII